MNKHLKYTLLAGIVVSIIALVLFDTFNNTTADKSYERMVRKLRAQKDNDFKYGNASPLTDEQKLRFTTLHYFEPDDTYKVQAVITPTQNDSVYKYLTTTNEIRRFNKYAYLDFTIDKKPKD